jgi:hypothetical protein
MLSLGGIFTASFWILKGATELVSGRNCIKSHTLDLLVVGMSNHLGRTHEAMGRETKHSLEPLHSSDRMAG